MQVLAGTTNNTIRNTEFTKTGRVIFLNNPYAVGTEFTTSLSLVGITAPAGSTVEADPTMLPGTYTVTLNGTPIQLPYTFP